MQYRFLSEHRDDMMKYYHTHQALLEKSSLIQTYRPGEMLLNQNTSPQNVFILLSGLVKVIHTTTLGKKFTWGVFERGEVLGDVEAIMGINYFSTVETVTNCTLWKVSPEQFLKMLAEDSDFNLLIHRAMISKLINTSYKAAIQGTNKLFYLLLVVLREFSRLNELQITKQLLSETLGTSLRNLNRLLIDLERDKVLKIEQMQIKEIDFTLLQQKIKEYENAVQ